MGSHAFFWVSTLLCLLTLKPYVYGGACTDGADCVQSAYVTTTCGGSKTCDCLSNDYASIRTGCGKKLTAPIAAPEAGRSVYLFTGTTGTLVCSTVAGASSYAWTLPDATVVQKNQINITAIGDYKCQAISNTASLNSDFSNTITVLTLGGGSSVTNYAGALTPDINYKDPNIYTGRTVTLSCSGIPMGYSGKVSFVDTNDAEIGSSTAPVLSTQVTMTSSNSAKTVACKLDNFNQVTFPKSTVTIILPRVLTSNPISAVTLTVKDPNGDINAETTYYVGAVGPTLTCTTTPVPAFLDSTKVIGLQYEFLAGTVSKQKNSSNTYTVDTSVTSNEFYKCIATFDGASQEKTLTFKIVVIPNALATAPALMKVSPSALTLGSKLVLSCGTTADATYTYTWLFNNTIIDGQVDWKIQLNNFAESDIGVYKCHVSKYGITTADSSLVAAVKPTVTRVPSGTFYGQGGDYVLRCTTGSSVTNGWTYSWKKGDNDLKITTDSYSIINATAAIHNGSYTCTSTYNGASGTSEPLPVAVEAAGKRCSTTGDCDTTKGYAGACPTALPQVCTCANYFVPRGEVCGLIKPTISRDPAGTAFYAGTNYVLTCNSGSDNTTGWTYAWKKDDGPSTITTATYNITGANAATHNGSYTCTATFSTVSSTSDALIVSVVASATAPFINCALMVIMAALGSLFI